MVSGTYGVATLVHCLEEVSLTVVPVVLHQLLVPLEQVSELAKLSHALWF